MSTHDSISVKHKSEDLHGRQRCLGTVKQDSLDLCQAVPLVKKSFLLTPSNLP